jgi:antitoxin component YwqK of YwqJK toxin-antitoxin module
MGHLCSEGYRESEGLYTNSNQDGVWVYYNRGGDISRKLTLKGGMASGMGWFYDKGRLTGQGIMTGLPKNPKINGQYTEFHVNGKPKSEGSYMLSRKNGPFREYHDNGALMAEGEYMNDKRNGNWKFYRKDGKTLDTELSGYYMMDRLNKKLSM